MDNSSYFVVGIEPSKANALYDRKMPLFVAVEDDVDLDEGWLSMSTIEMSSFISYSSYSRC